jgi:hypothetical protein
MNRVLNECWGQDIVTVVAAGNAGGSGESLDENTPTSLGSAANGLITVGGVDSTGLLAERTNFDAGRGGSITVYAVSENVVMADHTQDIGTETDSGTSFAAPAVVRFPVLSVW